MSVASARGSTLERVRSLPVVFDLDDVEKKLGCSRNWARKHCTTWKTYGFVEPVADHRSGTYFNVLRETSSPTTYLFEALDKLLGGRPLMLCGLSSLNRHGWTTQMEAIPEMIIRVERGKDNFPTISRARIMARYPRWHDKLLANSDDPKMYPESLRILRPEWALADAFLAHSRNPQNERMSGAWFSDYEDFDLDVLEPAIPAAMEAIRELGASTKEIEQFASLITPPPSVPRR